MTVEEMLIEFHKAYGQEIGEGFKKPSVRALRESLLREEFNEYIDGERNSDIVEIADALADIVYVAVGAAVAYGIPFDKVFAEVHASNMSKLGADGKPIKREDGKILKGPNYFRPRIAEIISAIQASPSGE